MLFLRLTVGGLALQQLSMVCASRRERSPRCIRVVHIASGDLWAGAEAQLYILAKKLSNLSEIALRVVLLNHGILERRLREQRVEVTVLDEKQLGSLQIFWQLYRLLEGIRPHIVHTHRRKENVLGSLAALFVRHCKCIRTVHGAAEIPVRPWQLRKIAYRLADWFCGRFVQDRIVAVSRDLGQSLARRFTARRIEIIPNGIDLNEVRVASQEPVEIPGLDGALKIAFAGRLVPVKRADIFVEVARQLIAHREDLCRFYIFGDGPMSEPLKQQVRKLGLEPYVFWMGFRESLPSYLARMDALLITSDHEGLPMNLLEALALNVPVIAHAVGEIPRVLGEGRYGEVIRTQEPKQYVSVVLGLAANLGAARRRASDGAQHVAHNYSVRRSAAAYVRLYEGLVK